MASSMSGLVARVTALENRELPAASATGLGAVRQGFGVSISALGVISSVVYEPCTASNAGDPKILFTKKGDVLTIRNSR